MEFLLELEKLEKELGLNEEVLSEEVAPESKPAVVKEEVKEPEAKPAVVKEESIEEIFGGEEEEETSDEDLLDLDSDYIVENVELFETAEGNGLIMEAFEESGLLAEEVLNERSIVKLDKQAKKSQLISKSVIVTAKETQDPLYRRLKKLNAERLSIMDKLAGKYSTKAEARVRELIRARKEEK